MAASAKVTTVVGLSTGGKVFFGSLCAGTFGLGCWQTARLFEKQALTQQRQLELAMEPSNDVALLSLLNTTTTNKNTTTSVPSFRRVNLDGTFHHEAEFLVGPRGPPPGALPDGPGTSAAGMSASPQGYFVMTPMSISNTNNSTTTTVIVNRGWIPRHLAPAPHEIRRMEALQARRQQQGSGRQQQQHQQTPTQHLQWNRPTERVTVTVVPTKGESPRFMVPGHDLTTHPPKFFWFDVASMQQFVVDALSLGIMKVADDGNDEEYNVQEVPLVTAVQNDSDDSNTILADIQWPVQPTAGAVGDFKVSPAVHTGYAFTWFGLSGAGLIMTRKLMSRGRA